MKTKHTKAKLLIASLIGFSCVSYAHQLKNDANHNTGWDWNQPSHTHDKVVPAPIPAPAPKPTVVRGMQGLDGIAKVGECYATAYVEESCKTANKKVLSKEAYNEIEVIPAVTKQVERKIMIEPAKTLEEHVPALYEVISQRVMVSEARTEWKKGNSTSTQRVINGDTYCLVKVPARYENRTKKVLRIPASTRTKTIPAVYKTYKETVIVKPATTRVVKSHPAVYKEVSECVEKTAGHYEWRSILCEENATSSVLTAFEKALSGKGHLSSSKVDGVIDNSTTNAIKAYQRSSGLKVDGLVNMDTVKSLGVKY